MDQPNPSSAADHANSAYSPGQEPARELNVDPSRPRSAGRRASDQPGYVAPSHDQSTTLDQSAAMKQMISAAGYTGLERRRGAGRRLSDYSRSAEEGDLTKEQFLFIMAVNEFKRVNDKPYPSWSDILEVVRLLGYRKVGNSEIALRNAEDWKEKPDAPSNVRPENWVNRLVPNSPTRVAATSASAQPPAGPGKKAA